MTAFFDLDGCLVDSRAAITAAMNHALVSLGFAPRPARELYPYIGPPLRAAFIELLGGEPRADEAVD
ncbi:MAG: HAD hydrolase-like protein, partial [Nitriliruptorales bacterium]|nr:HAD hydrolase-like protein [Nitriliruptorales bacterium]